MENVELEFTSHGADQTTGSVEDLRREVLALRKEVLLLVKANQGLSKSEEEVRKGVERTRKEAIAAAGSLGFAAKQAKDLFIGISKGVKPGALAGLAFAAEEAAFAVAKVGISFTKTALQGVKSMFTLKNQLLGLGAAFGLVFTSKQFIDAGRFVQNLDAQFRFLFGSAQQANDEFREIIAFTKTTPFEIPSLAAATRDLKAVGQLGTETVRILADAAVTARVDIVQAANAFISGTNRIFRPLRQFGILTRATADQVRFSFTSAAGEARQVIVKNNQAIIASTLEAILNEKYGGALKRFEGLYDNLFSNLKDEWTNFTIFVSTELGVLESAAGGLRAALDVIGRNGPLIERVGVIVATVLKDINSLTTQMLGLAESIAGPLITAAEGFQNAFRQRSLKQLGVDMLVVAGTAKLLGLEVETGVKSWVVWLTIWGAADNAIKSATSGLKDFAREHKKTGLALRGLGDILGSVDTSGGRLGARDSDISRFDQLVRGLDALYNAIQRFTGLEEDFLPSTERFDERSRQIAQVSRDVNASLEASNREFVQNLRDRDSIIGSIFPEGSAGRAAFTTPLNPAGFAPSLLKSYEDLSDDIHDILRDDVDAIVFEYSRITDALDLTTNQAIVLQWQQALDIAKLYREALEDPALQGGPFALDPSRIAQLNETRAAVEKLSGEVGLSELRLKLDIGTGLKVESSPGAEDKIQKALRVSINKITAKAEAIEAEGATRALLGIQATALAASDELDPKLAAAEAKLEGIRKKTEAAEEDLAKRREAQLRIERQSSRGDVDADVLRLSQQFVRKAREIRNGFQAEEVEAEEELDSLRRTGVARRKLRNAQAFDLQRSFDRSIERLRDQAAVGLLQAEGRTEEAEVTRVRISVDRQLEQLTRLKDDAIALAQERREGTEMIERQFAADAANVARLGALQIAERARKIREALQDEAAVLSVPEGQRDAVAEAIGLIRKLQEEQIALGEGKEAQAAYQNFWVRMSELQRDGARELADATREATLAFANEQTKQLSNALTEARDEYRKFAATGVDQGLLLDNLKRQTDEIINEANRGKRALRDLAVEANESIGTGLSGVFSEAVLGAGNLKEALRDLLQSFADRALNLGLEAIFSEGLGRLGEAFDAKEGTALGDLFGTQPDVGVLEQQAAEIMKEAAKDDRETANLFDGSVKLFDATIRSLSNQPLGGGGGGGGGGISTGAFGVGTNFFATNNQSPLKPKDPALGDNLQDIQGDLRKAAGLEVKAAGKNEESSNKMLDAAGTSLTAGIQSLAAAGTAKEAGISMGLAAAQMVIAAIIDAATSSAAHGGITSNSVPHAGMPIRVHRNEAIIPLDELPSILQKSGIGGGGGGGGISIQQSIVIESGGGARTTQSSEGQAEGGGDLGRAINEAVVGVILEQQRPGGALNRRSQRGR